jgi:hypothetical protein
MESTALASPAPPGVGGLGTSGVGGVGGTGTGESLRSKSGATGCGRRDASASSARRDQRDQYLDTRVSDAVQHLEGQLPAEQMDFVKTSLREHLASDPVLMELVRRATGAIPSEPG